MKKALKVIGILVLIVVVIAVGLAAWQWKYVSALIDGIRYDETALGEKQLQNTEQTITEMNNQVSVELRELTDEEKQKIASGELSQTAVMAQIFAEAMGTAPAGEAGGEAQPPAQSGDASLPQTSTEGADNSQGEPSPQTPASEGSETAQQPTVQPSDTAPSGGQAAPGASNSKDGASSGKDKGKGNAPAGTAPPSQTAPMTSDQLIANAVSELYSLQSQYTAQIDGLISRVKSYYREQRAANGAAAARSSTLSKFSGEVASMESACDEKVDAVLGDLSGKLNSMGADTSIISTLRSAYENEKSVQRAAYVRKYMK